MYWFGNVLVLACVAVSVVSYVHCCQIAYILTCFESQKISLCSFLRFETWILKVCRFGSLCWHVLHRVPLMCTSNFWRCLSSERKKKDLCSVSASWNTQHDKVDEFTCLCCSVLLAFNSAKSIFILVFFVPREAISVVSTSSHNCYIPNTNLTFL